MDTGTLSEHLKCLRHVKWTGMALARTTSSRCPPHHDVQVEKQHACHRPISLPKTCPRLHSQSLPPSLTLDTNTKIYARSFYPNTIRQWNCLPPPPCCTGTHTWRIQAPGVPTATSTLRPRQERPPTTGGCLGGGWAHRVLSTGDLRVLLRCVMSFVFLPVLLPILISNSNLLPPFMLFYPCSFYRACLCIMVIAMTAHSIGR